MKPRRSFHFTQQCVRCTREYEADRHVIRCDCGELIDFEYDLDTSKSWKPDRRFSGLMRYWRFLPVTSPSRAVSSTGHDGPTPLFRSKKLGEFLGLSDLWIKDESRNFTKSFKARDAIVCLSRFQEIGVREFVLASTGNTAAAFCNGMRRMRGKIAAHLFVPKTAVIDFPLSNVKNLVRLDGNYQETLELARSYSRETAIPFEGGFANPCRREGSKTLAYEVAEAGLRPDWYVQSVASGTGAYGFHQGFGDLRSIGFTDKVPRVLCVQPEGCSPMVNAFKKRHESLSSDDVVDHPNTFATTLANGNPSFSYPYVRHVVLDSMGLMESVTEAEIAQAFLLLVKLEAILPEPAAAVALAGAVKMKENGLFEKDSTILLNISGGLRTSRPRTPAKNSISSRTIRPVSMLQNHP